MEEAVAAEAEPEADAQEEAVEVADEISPVESQPENDVEMDDEPAVVEDEEPEPEQEAEAEAENSVDESNHEPVDVEEQVSSSEPHSPGASAEGREPCYCPNPDMEVVGEAAQIHEEVVEEEQNEEVAADAESEQAAVDD